LNPGVFEANLKNSMDSKNLKEELVALGAGVQIVQVMTGGVAKSNILWLDHLGFIQQRHRMRFMAVGAIRDFPFFLIFVRNILVRRNRLAAGCLIFGRSLPYLIVRMAGQAFFSDSLYFDLLFGSIKRTACGSEYAEQQYAC
jgi:hypothetical protein